MIAIYIRDNLNHIRKEAEGKMRTQELEEILSKYNTKDLAWTTMPGKDMIEKLTEFGHKMMNMVDELEGKGF